MERPDGSGQDQPQDDAGKEPRDTGPDSLANFIPEERLGGDIGGQAQIP